MTMTAARGFSPTPGEPGPRRPTESWNRTDDGGAIVGDSDALRYVMFRVDQVAATEATVLLCGETGTGKELLAHAIHRAQPAPRPPFRGRQLRGAAGDADRERTVRPRARRLHRRAHQPDRPLRAGAPRHGLPRRGRRAAARAPAAAAARAAGRARSSVSAVRAWWKSMCRIIAATNRDLSEEVRRGRFRRDLYYRLNVFPITLPTLARAAQRHSGCWSAIWSIASAARWASASTTFRPT